MAKDQRSGTSIRFIVILALLAAQKVTKKPVLGLSSGWSFS